jgi:antitoxin StbD
MATLLADLTLPISEFKKNPAAAIKRAGGRATAILTHSEPTFYAVPAALYERLLDAVEDAQLARIARERAGSTTVAVDLADL